MFIKQYIGQRSAAIYWLALSALLFFSFAARVRAQSGSDVSPPRQGAMTSTEQARPNEQGAPLFRALNLSPEQRAQIRTIREQTENERRVLGPRFRRAQRALEEAIYSDNADENLIQERIREVAAAQEALIRMRALAELKVRRVLTAEQLNTLRDLRRQAALQNLNRRREARSTQMQSPAQTGDSLNRSPNPNFENNKSFNPNSPLRERRRQNPLRDSRP